MTKTAGVAWCTSNVEHLRRAGIVFGKDGRSQRLSGGPTEVGV